jgi:hypothetical protein
MLRTFVIATAALASVLAGVLGLATAAAASGWRTNPDIYEYGLFLDVSTYKILPNGARQVWVLQSFQKPVETSGGRVDFRVSLLEFDCAQRTTAAKYTVVYFMDGKSDANDKAPLASDTNAERMSDVVCGDMSRLTAVAGEAPAIAHRFRAIGKMALQ